MLNENDRKSINFHKKYEVLHDLKGEFLNEIKLIYTFYLYFENRSNVLIVTNDDLYKYLLLAIIMTENHKYETYNGLVFNKIFAF